MAGTKVSFDDIIQAGRRKRRHEELAQQMLGSGRRQTAPAATNNNRQSRKTGDLASRIGVSRRNNANSRNDRGPIRVTAGNNNNNNNTVFPSRLAPQPSTNRQRGKRAAARQSGINIRGLASGLHLITASNFAPGTTAEDIERALQGSGHGASLQSCRITAASPTVMADLTYSNAADADKFINAFNNKPADGRILHVYYKDNSVAAPQIIQPLVPASQPVAAPQPIVAPQPMQEDYTMQVDDTMSQREAENRMREDRRGAGARDRREVVAAGSRDRRGYYEDWEGARPGPRYHDSRSGFGEDARQPRSYGRRYNRGA